MLTSAKRACLMLCLLVSFSSVAYGQAEFKFTILHTNDTHGHLLPFPYLEVGRAKVQEPSVGGAARRATLIRQLKQQSRNPVVVVDGGDTFTRGPLTNAYEGLADAEVMSAIGYDIAVIGNNEFKAKDGVEKNDAEGSKAALLKVIRSSAFSWICANATDEKGGLLPGVKPFVVRNLGGVRVGFLGLTTFGSARYSQIKGWTILDPIQTAKEWIPRARKECDLLVAVTHMGAEADQQLIAATSGIDAVVGGHTHTFLYKAIEAKNADGKSIPIVQTGEFGVNLGKFDLTLRKDAEGSYSLASFKYELIPIRGNLREDPEVASIVNRLVKPLQKVVGRVFSIGAGLDIRLQQTTQLIVDSAKAISGADLSMNPVGAGTFGTFDRREITLYDIYYVMPFRNNVSLVALTGAEIEALKSKHPTTVMSSNCPPLEPARSYRVGMIDFVASDSYGIDKTKLTETNLDIRNAVIEHLKKITKEIGSVDSWTAPRTIWRGALACAVR